MLDKIGKSMYSAVISTRLKRLSVKKGVAVRMSGGKKYSGTGTRTLVSCVRGKYANHLHHTGTDTEGERIDVRDDVTIYPETKINPGHRPGSKRYSGTGTRTLVSCVRGKYANHLHHTGTDG
jgi:hypothetical protein